VALTGYLTQTQLLLHDPTNSFYSQASLISYINIARGQIAGDGGCVRVLLSGGTITALSVNGGGSGYAGTLTVAITNGNQASATGTISGGAVNAVTLVNGGWGFLTGPIVTATGSTSGSNATFNTTVDQSASTVAGQEVYNFSTLNMLAALTPGVQNVVGVMGIACQWGAGSVYKPTLRRRTWSTFQARYRSYTVAAMNFPAVWASYGHGASGSFYLFPIPSQQMSLDIDAACLPIPLVTDSTVEAIPYPWTDAIPYYAAYLAYSNSQRAQDAMRMFEEYNRFMRRAEKMSEPPFTPDEYDGEWP
jgi:hypothetical protein